MKISEAMKAASDEYNAEVEQARTNRSFDRLIRERMHDEYDEIDKELPEYIAEIAQGMGVTVGTILPPYVYTAARMAFRFGMRVQRKLDHPHAPTTIFWQQGVKH